MVMRMGLKENWKIFCWSFSTNLLTRLVADARATLLTGTLTGRARVQESLTNGPHLSVCAEKEEKAARGAGDRTRDACAKFRAH